MPFLSVSVPARWSQHTPAEATPCGWKHCADDDDRLPDYLDEGSIFRLSLLTQPQEKSGSERAIPPARRLSAFLGLSFV